MTELSDYKRLVEKPMLEALHARIRRKSEEIDRLRSELDLAQAQLRQAQADYVTSMACVVFAAGGTVNVSLDIQAKAPLLRLRTMESVATGNRLFVADYA